MSTAESTLTAPPGRAAEVRRLWGLTWTLAITDWKLRFYGSALGVLWTLVRPFAFFGVILFVFTKIAKLDASVKNYDVYILFALVLFTFFAEVTAGCVQSLVSRENLLRKMQFNPVVIPLSIGVTALMNLGMTLIAVMIYVLANGVYPDWGWLQLIPIVVLLATFAIGIGMLLSVLFVRYRDIHPIWEVASQMLFYASSTLYVATTVPEEYRTEFLFNPISALFAQVRHAVVDPTAPTLYDLMGSAIVVPFVLIAVTFVGGVAVFLRESPRVAENL